MDKLTLTRQFWIQFGIFLGKFREEIGNFSSLASYPEFAIILFPDARNV